MLRDLTSSARSVDALILIHLPSSSLMASANLSDDGVDDALVVTGAHEYVGDAEFTHWRQRRHRRSAWRVRKLDQPKIPLSHANNHRRATALFELTPVARGSSLNGARSTSPNSLGSPTSTV